MKQATDLQWGTTAEILFKVDGDTAVLSANREGLLSLPAQLAALAEERPGAHIHYNAFNALEEGSSELIVEKIPEKNRRRE